RPRGVVHPRDGRRPAGQDLGERRHRARHRSGLPRRGPRGTAVNEFLERRVTLRWAEPKSAYDVVIIGGGGHGLSTAYWLARNHGITDVAVVERGYIGGGNSGRNTTVIRANYGIPEAIRFYQRSLELYQQLEDDSGRWVMHQEKGLIWTVHSEG